MFWLVFGCRMFWFWVGWCGSRVEFFRFLWTRFVETIEKKSFLLLHYFLVSFSSPLFPFWSDATRKKQMSWEILAIRLGIVTPWPYLGPCFLALHLSHLTTILSPKESHLNHWQALENVIIFYVSIYLSRLEVAVPF